MTQLFDTDTYEDTETSACETSGTGPTAPRRHLRSVRSTTGATSTTPPIRWRLDDQTIETGRRGIQAARQALQAAAKDNKTTVRKAA